MVFHVHFIVHLYIALNFKSFRYISLDKKWRPMYKMVFLAEDELEGNQFQMCLQVGWAMDSHHGSLITWLEDRVVISKKNAG